MDLAALPEANRRRALGFRRMRRIAENADWARLVAVTAARAPHPAAQPPALAAHVL